jgi:hypothetical protein
MKTNISLRLIFAAVALALCASASAQVFTGSVTASDPTQDGRLFRDGMPSMAGMNKPFPGVTMAGTPYHYDSYIFTNPFAVSTAFTISLNTTSNNNPFAVVYLGAFNPMNLATNYRADGGFSPTPTSGPLSFSFDIPAGAMFTVVINETLAGGAQLGIPSDYTFTLAVVPEPSTVLQLSMGAALVGVWAWRRHSRKAGDLTPRTPSV